MKDEGSQGWTRRRRSNSYAGQRGTVERCIIYRQYQRLLFYAHKNKIQMGRTLHKRRKGKKAWNNVKLEIRYARLTIPKHAEQEQEESS